MAKDTFYGIKFPFENESWRKTYFDMNESREDEVRSEIVHILFTPKGQRLRMPDFGTDLVKYIFELRDEETLENIKKDATEQISQYLENVTFKDLSTYTLDEDEHSLFVLITYTVKDGNTEIENKISVPIV